MEHLAASSRQNVALGIAFALVAMVFSFLAVLAATSSVQIGSAAQAQYAQATSDECANTSPVETFTGTQDQTTDEPFRITSDKFRIAFETERNGGDPTLEVTVLNEQGQPTGQSFVVRDGDDGSRIIPLGPGAFRLGLRADNVRYRVTVEECRADSASNVNVAQETTGTTTALRQTTTDDTTTSSADAAADAEALTDDLTGAERAEGAFRCELFLRIVEDGGFDGRGFARRFDGRRDAGFLQYFDDFDDFDEDLLVQRIEECREREVLADTFPDERLADTGGPPLLLLAALSLGAVVAGATVLRAALRRGE
jgi:hypothetical protein